MASRSTSSYSGGYSKPSRGRGRGASRNSPPKSRQGQQGRSYVPYPPRMTYQQVKAKLPIAKIDKLGSYKYWEDVRGNTDPSLTLAPFAKSIVPRLNQFNSDVLQNPYYHPINGKKVAKAYLGKADEFVRMDQSYKVKEGQRDPDTSYVPRQKWNIRAQTVNVRKDEHAVIYRAGSLPYYRGNDGVIYYGFGIDATSKLGLQDITDFGGGMETGECCAQAALREWYEETGGRFESYVIVPDSLVAYYNGMATFFTDAKFPGTADEFSKLISGDYERDKRAGKEPETRGMQWLNKEQILDRINNPGATHKIYDQLYPVFVNIQEIDVLILGSYP